MLSDYCKNVLQAELSKPDYDGMKAESAWAWLMLPTTSNAEVDTHLKLTPIVAAAILGPVKANAIAEKIAQSLPFIASALMQEGVDISHPETLKFLGSLGLDQADMDAVTALSKKTVTTVTPRRFDERFLPSLWPHLNEKGEAGSDEDKAISGFPNDLERGDFDAAWVAAGRG